MPQTLDINWDVMRTRMKSAFSGRVRFEDRSLVDDLTQEGLVRILRASRTMQIENLDAFLNTIVQRVWIDHVRRRASWRRIFDPLEEGTERGAAAPPSTAECETGTPVSRTRFLVMEFFRTRKSACLPLASEYFRELDWNQVAEQLGRSHAAVRQQWKRCVDALRMAVTMDAVPALATIFEELAEMEG
jgi:DNA-directed RNA polymerase specialized sigma24 family protein